MAKTEKTKQKKNIVQRMMFGNENKPDLTPEHMKMSKWEMFKYLFFQRFGTMVALNMLTCLFAIPGIFIFVMTYMNIAVVNTLVPFSGNLGIGYTVTINAAATANVAVFSYELMRMVYLIPCIAIFALGVAGNLYVMRKLIWDQPVRTFKDFFIGIKKCWLSALLVGIAFGFTLLFLVFSLGYFDVYYPSTALKALCITLSIILLVFMILFASFVMTQSAAFKMRGMVLIRNSVLFIVGTHIMSIVMIGVGIAPVFLAFIPNITMLYCMLYVFIGISFSTLVISLYCHYCYERFLYDKIDDVEPVYVKRVSDVQEEGNDKNNKKRQTPTPYKNPKKRKKSIDEGSTITPLTPTFRREDLERLQAEHDQVLSETTNDDNAVSDDSDIKDGTDSSDEAAERSNAVDEKVIEEKNTVDVVGENIDDNSFSNEKKSKNKKRKN